MNLSRLSKCSNEIGISGLETSFNIGDRGLVIFVCLTNLSDQIKHFDSHLLSQSGMRDVKVCFSLHRFIDSNTEGLKLC